MAGVLSPSCVSMAVLCPRAAQALSPPGSLHAFGTLVSLSPAHCLVCLSVCLSVRPALRLPTRCLQHPAPLSHAPVLTRRCHPCTWLGIRSILPCVAASLLPQAAQGGGERPGAPTPNQAPGPWGTGLGGWDCGERGLPSLMWGHRVPPVSCRRGGPAPLCPPSPPWHGPTGAADLAAAPAGWGMWGSPSVPRALDQRPRLCRLAALLSPTAAFLVSRGSGRLAAALGCHARCCSGASRDRVWGLERAGSCPRLAPMLGVREAEAGQGGCVGWLRWGGSGGWWWGQSTLGPDPDCRKQVKHGCL